MYGTYGQPVVASVDWELKTDSDLVTTPSLQMVEVSVEGHQRKLDSVKQGDLALVNYSHSI